MIQCAVSWQCHALQQKQRALPRGRRAERIGGAASAHRVRAGDIDVRETWATRQETSSTAAWNCPCSTAAPSAVTRPVLPAWPQLVDRLAGLEALLYLVDVARLCAAFQKQAQATACSGVHPAPLRVAARLRAKNAEACQECVPFIYRNALESILGG